MENRIIDIPGDVGVSVVYRYTAAFERFRHRRRLWYSMVELMPASFRNLQMASQPCI